MTIYLDHAATSFPKPESVLSAVERVLREIGGNPGRGGHRMALAAGRLLLEARETAAGFFGIRDAARVVFTPGATYALNQALFGLLQPGDRVVTTSVEHNALCRPLNELERRGVVVEKIAADACGFVTLDQVKGACRVPTRLVAMSHASNVTGSIQPIGEIGRWCRAQGILLLVDAAQSAGLLPLDVEQQGIDLLAVAGHKGLYGPSGTGLLYLRPGLQLVPLVFGGTGANSSEAVPPEELPERLEAGTLNIPGIAGLKAGIEFVRETGPGVLRERKLALLERLYAGLGGIPGVRMVGPASPGDNCGVVSFLVDERDPAEIGFQLDTEYGILGRVGLHCAPDAHRTIGTFPYGTVRVSPGYFTTEAEIDQFLVAVHRIAGEV